MASLNAQKVALKVSETIRKGKRVHLGKIIRENGYSLETSLSPTLVTRTKSYKAIMKPLEEKLKYEIDRIANELSNKDLSKERYDTLATALDKLNKNYQLITGGATENTRMTVEISETIAKKNKLNDTPRSSE